MRRGALLLLCAGWLVSAGEENAAPYAGFAGTKSCARCHERETRAWEASFHARHAAWVAEPEGGADGAVGSHWMQAYFKRDPSGYQRIVPRCYDLREKRWRPVMEVLAEIRGGAEGPTEQRPLETRSFDLSCSGCHASQPRPRFDGATGRIDTRWADLAINCETCHGPGGAHGEAWARLLETKPSLPRLELLDTRAATALCARCHGGPPTQGDFGPADAARFVGVIVDRPGFFPDGTASGQFYQHSAFVRSPCHLEGGLSCTGCHEAHGPGLLHRQHPDALCTRCHEDHASYDHTFHDATKDGARCVSCHMPRLLGGLMAHQRDHRIGVPLPASPHAPDACTTCHKDKNKQWADAAFRERWGKPSPKTLRAIEAIELARRQDERARPLLERALTHPDPFFRANAALYLGDPAPILDDPLPEVRMVAVHAARRSPQPDAALERLARDPEPVIRAMAHLTRLSRGAKLEQGIRSDLEIAVRHVRDLPEAHLALGTLALGRGDGTKAAAHFESALAFRPTLDPAWIGLATACEAQGEPARAAAVRQRRAEVLARRAREEPTATERLRLAIGAFLEAGQPERAHALIEEVALALPRGLARERVLEMLLRFERMHPEVKR